MRKVTLTFDNGPSIGNTDRILDILRERGIRTTFFLVGQNLVDPAARALAARAKDEGHWIGNHSMRHLVPFGMSDDPDHPEKEIGEADRAIGDLAHTNKFLRPPGKAKLGPHILSKAALEYCVAHAHTIVTWNNIPRDGIEPRDGWIARAMAAVEEQDWTVSVVHDHHLGHAMQNLVTFIDQAEKSGATFVQDFPDSVCPMVRGEVRHPIETFVTI